LGKSMHQEHGGGFGGHIVIWWSLMELWFISMVGLPYFSSFKCLTACLFILKYVSMGWNFDACRTFQVLFYAIVVSNSIVL
jgi:hypothetical protein